MKFKALLFLIAIPVASQSMDRIPFVGSGSDINLKTLAGAFMSWILTVTGHEYGHAIAGKLLYNSPINIRVGWNINPESKPIFKLGGLHVYGLPLWGYATVNPNKEARLIDEVIDQKKKKIAIDTAGPLVGFVTGIAVQAVLNRLGFGSYYSLLPQIANLINLIPMRNENDLSDGASIWESIKIIRYLLAEKKFMQSMRKQ